jgi:hypothetical protein
VGAVFGAFTVVYDSLYNVEKNKPFSFHYSSLYASSLSSFKSPLPSSSENSIFFFNQLKFLRTISPQALQQVFNFFSPPIPRRSSLDDYIVSSLQVCLWVIVNMLSLLCLYKKDVKTIRLLMQKWDYDLKKRPTPLAHPATPLFRIPSPFLSYPSSVSPLEYVPFPFHTSFHLTFPSSIPETVFCHTLYNMNGSAESGYGGPTAASPYYGNYKTHIPLLVGNTLNEVVIMGKKKKRILMLFR